MNAAAIQYIQSLRADPYPTPDYQVCRSPQDVQDYLFSEITYFTLDGLLANDTESIPGGATHCLTFSHTPGTGRLIYRDDTTTLDYYRQCIIDHKPHLLFHNYLHDSVPFDELSLPIGQFTDTYVRAYNLCLGGGGDEDESGGGRGLLSLKVLAWRLCNMEMKSFKDTVYPHSKLKVMGWLQEVADTFEPGVPVVTCEYCQCPDHHHEIRGKVRLKHSGPCTICPRVVCPRFKKSKQTKDPGDKLHSLLRRKSLSLLKKLTLEASVNPGDTYEGEGGEGSKVTDPWKQVRDWHDHDHQLLEDYVSPCPMASVADVPEQELLAYACLSSDSKVATPNGYMSIGSMVKNKYKGKVYTYNKKKQRLETRKVTGHYRIKHQSKIEWFSVRTEHSKSGRWGVGGVRYTADHRILTTEGYKRVDKLEKGDKILTPVQRLSACEWQLVYGSLLGDGSITQRNAGGWACLRFDNNIKQKKYLQWKRSLMTNLSSSVSESKEVLRIICGVRTAASVFYNVTSETHPELIDMRHASYLTKGKKNIGSWINNLGVLGLAIWYQDDGTLVDGKTARLYTLSFSVQDVDRLRQYLLVRFGIKSGRYEDRREGREGQWTITISTQNSGKFFELIAGHIHPSMQYKLPLEWRGLFNPKLSTKSPGLVESKVIEVIHRPQSPGRKGSTYYSYCIDVEETHNFATMHEVAHNCRDADATLRLYLTLKDYNPWIFWD